MTTFTCRRPVPPKLAIGAIRAGRSPQSDRLLKRVIQQFRRVESFKFIKMEDIRGNWEVSDTFIRPLVHRPFITFIPDIMSGEDIQYCRAWGVNIINLEGPQDKKVKREVLQKAYVSNFTYDQITEDRIKWLAIYINICAWKIQGPPERQRGIWDVPDIPRDILIS